MNPNSRIIAILLCPFIGLMVTALLVADADHKRQREGLWCLVPTLFGSLIWTWIIAAIAHH